MKPSLTIIGSGWISTHFLSQHATKFNKIITVSKSSQKPSASTHHYHYDIYHPTNIKLPSSDICIITIPFKKNLKSPNDYPNGLINLLTKKNIANYKKIIFTSSTSIYPNNGNIVTEQTEIDTTHRAKALHTIENYLLNSSKSCIILRVAGICGKNRNSLKKVKSPIINNAKTPMNLVHVDDIINTMITLCKQSSTPSDIINLCCTKHPSRIDYYSFICKQFNIPLPQFKKTITEHKLVSNKKLIQNYNLTLKFESPLTFIFDQHE